MQESTSLNLTVYKPVIMAGPEEQVGFDYTLTIVVPELKTAVKGEPSQASSARCDVVAITGALEFPNPAAPVISPYTGLMFIYDNAPLIGFPLSIMAQSTGTGLKFNMNLSFPASPLYFYSGAIMFGDWPGPLRDVTASFLCPQPT
jgi:hypothetical protein